MTHRRLVVDGCQINNWDEQVVQELRNGAVSAVQATCAVWENARETLTRLAEWQDRFASFPNELVAARSTADILDAYVSERVAILLGFQNTAPIEDDPRLLEVFWRLGVRVIQLTYNVQNAVGGSCFEPVDSGLSRFGHTIVEEMNRLGLLVDCSHVGDRTTRDAIDASSKPIAITHANPRWFCDTARNKPDHVLNALAERGGVVGVTMYPLFVGGADTTLEQFTAMVVKLLDQLGLEHVALGTDLSRNWTDRDLVTLRNGRQMLNPPAASWPAPTPWFRTCDDLPAVLDAFEAAGLSEAEVDAVCGLNWMRLYDRVFRSDG